MPEKVNLYKIDYSYTFFMSRNRKTIQVIADTMKEALEKAEHVLEDTNGAKIENVIREGSVYL